jgi:hypothetical protein
MTFLFGDIVESIVVSLAKMAGCQLMATGGDQLTIKLKVGDKEVFGHPDGILWHENEWVLFECKSMSTFRYADFEKGIIDEDYIAQMNAYMHSLGLNKCVIVALNKDNSVIGERLIQKDDKVVEYLLNNMNIVLQSKEDALPDRKYGADDKGFYPWVCLYCSYWKTCLPNAEEILVSKRYKLREKKDGHTQSS